MYFPAYNKVHVGVGSSAGTPFELGASIMDKRPLMTVANTLANEKRCLGKKKGHDDIQRIVLLGHTLLDSHFCYCFFSLSLLLCVAFRLIDCFHDLFFLCQYVLLYSCKRENVVSVTVKSNLSQLKRLLRPRSLCKSDRLTLRC